MRLDTGENVIQSDETIARLLKGTHVAGVPMMSLPIVAKPLSVSALSILSALSTAQLGAPSSNASGPIDKVAFRLFGNKWGHLHDFTTT